jgi:hypothetical protein
MSKLVINLTGGVTDYEQIIDGNGFFYAVGASNIYVKYDDKTNDDADLIKPKSNVCQKFNKIYITGSANETIELYIHKTPEEALSYATELSNAVSSSLDNSQTAVNDTADIVWSATDTIKEGSIRNVGTNDVYVGGADVTTADGYLLKSGESLALNYYTGNLYAVCATGLTSDVRMLRVL